MNPTDIQNMQQLLKSNARNMISLNIGTQNKVIWGRTKLGGRPDVPADFIWPTFSCASFDDDEIRERPLAFIAQFDCGALSAMDYDHLLPNKGLLSFFYELDTSPDGGSREDAGCARVFWFDGTKPLSPAAFPEDLNVYNQLPRIALDIHPAPSFPSWDEFMLGYHEEVTEEFFEAYQIIYEEMQTSESNAKLLGYPDAVFDNLFVYCELIRQGYPIEDGIDLLPEQALEQAEKGAADWCLLIELHLSENDAFNLGDACLSFCIRRQDLESKRFDRVWMMLQWL